MMALRMEPNERRLISLYDQAEPRFRLSKKSLIAFGCVTVFYAGLGVLVMTQKVELIPATYKAEKPIVLERYINPVLDDPKPIPDPVKTPPPLDFHDAIPTDIPPPIPPLTVPRIEDPAPAPVGPVAKLDTPVTPTPTVTTPTPVPNPVIRNPTWLSKPSADQLGRLYPERAARMGRNGAATLLCSVTASGSMSGCSVIDESPKGWNFGDAALASAKFFKISPRTVDGAAVEGAKVRIPIVFNLG